MSEIIQRKVVWHAVLLLDGGMKEKKQHCFHLVLRLNHSVPEIAHICEEKQQDISFR